MSASTEDDLQPAIDYLENLAASLTPDQTRAVEQLAAASLDGKLTLGAVHGYGPKEIEAMYGVAYELYEQRKYDRAQKLFELLVLYEGPVARFWLGLGGCYQHQGEYRKAITAYSLVALCDASSPTGSFHACECFIALREWDHARQALDAVRTLCNLIPDEGEERARLLVRAEALEAAIESAAA